MTQSYHCGRRITGPAAQIKPPAHKKDSPLSPCALCAARSPYHHPQSHNSRQARATPGQTLQRERDLHSPAPARRGSSPADSGLSAARETRWGRTRRTRRCSGRGWAPPPARPAPRTPPKTAWSVPFLPCPHFSSTRSLIVPCPSELQIDLTISGGAISMLMLYVMRLDSTIFEQFLLTHPPTPLLQRKKTENFG